MDKQTRVERRDLHIAYAKLQHTERMRKYQRIAMELSQEVERFNGAGTSRRIKLYAGWRTATKTHPYLKLPYIQTFDVENRHHMALKEHVVCGKVDHTDTTDGTKIKADTSQPYLTFILSTCCYSIRKKGNLDPFYHHYLNFTDPEVKAKLESLSLS